jgi:uncharacterized protein YhfF
VVEVLVKYFSRLSSDKAEEEGEGDLININYGIDKENE